ncbi:MAG: GIY-YIG nuclease family protein [Minisyncoccia bacterium]
MYTVYVLKDKNNKVYKGFTNDIKRRLQEHKSGHTKTTSKTKELELVYKEEINDFKTARERELYLKSAAGRKFLKKVLV